MCSSTAESCMATVADLRPTSSDTPRCGPVSRRVGMARLSTEQRERVHVYEAAKSGLRRPAGGEGVPDVRHYGLTPTYHPRDDTLDVEADLSEYTGLGVGGGT